MNNNLGKIIFLLCVTPYLLFATAPVVTLNAPDTFYKNDPVSFSIVAIGKDIKIPEITQIDGNPVQTTGTSRQTTIVNGDTTYQMVKSYVVFSSKDIKIPSFKIRVDNNIELTDTHTIKMLKVEKTKSKLYDLTIAANKNDVYVGESVAFTLKFKYKKDLEVVSLDYTKPTFESFWVKELKVEENPNKNPNNEYVEQEVKYLLFPQKAGDIELGALKIGVTTLKGGYNRNFYLSSPTDTTPVYSNKLQLKVKALPKGINLVGDFKISSTVNKQTINQGEAVSYKLFIEGRGNVDDLDEVSINIPGTTIYDNPSKKEFDLENSLYGGKYTKSYSIVSKNDFTIPSVELKYFDKSTKTVKTIKTKSYKITVNGVAQNQKKLEVSKVEKTQQDKNIKYENSNTTTVKTSSLEKIIYFVLGFLFASILYVIYQFSRKKKYNNTETPLLKLVKKSKNKDELFKLLVVYINIDEELDKIIYSLETLSDNEYKKEQKNIIRLLNELIQKDIKLDTRL
jgi:hypothetical protein